MYPVWWPTPEAILFPGAAVHLENTGNLTVRSYITGNDGHYYFAGLNDDIDFTLRARLPELVARPKTLGKFDSENHPRVNLVIPID